MALKDTDLITYKTLKSVVAKQNETYDIKYVAKASLTESVSGNLKIAANDKEYELLSVDSPINVNNLTGVIGVEHIPQAALERVVPVANQAARFQLTEAQAQLGDVIKENDTGKMFFVTDLTNLGNANGYMEFSVGTAANVSWENVSNKPELAAASHTHSGSEITSAVTNATNASNVPWTGVSNKPALAASLSISGSTLALKDSEGVNMSSVTLPEVGNGSSNVDMTGFESQLSELDDDMSDAQQAARQKEEENRTDEDWDALYDYVPVTDSDDIKTALVKICWMTGRRPTYADLYEMYRPIYPEELNYALFNIGDAPEDGFSDNWIIDLQALRAFKETYDSKVVTREGFAKEYAGNITWNEGSAYNLKYRETDRHYNEKSGTWEEPTYINVLTDMSPLNAAHLQGTIPSDCMPSDIAKPVIWTAYSTDANTLMLGVTDDRSYEVLTNECTLNADALVGTVPVASLPSSVLMNTSFLDASKLIGKLPDTTIPSYLLTAGSNLDATKLVGTIPVANLPPEALASGGSSSGGSSNGGSSSAEPLSPAGSEYQPVYINNSGVPTACGFKIMQVSSLPDNPDQDTLYIVTGV